MDIHLVKNIQNDRFARLAGIELIKVDPGYALASMAVEDKHLNGVDMVQGGALFTLGDYAFAAACNAGGQPTVGINVSMSFIKSPRGKIITAEAKEVSTQRRLCTYQVNIYDEDRSLTAAMLCTGYIKRQDPPPPDIQGESVDDGK
ncbi:MAG: PaaI family thioesterase [Spirochaetales bacterium]|jgi:acyl-CoA thioesterase|nr:PaaI family thioesterase [Spirochaetales bacterium]